MHRTEKELRCDCKHKPLLATYGINRERELYVRVKIVKSGRLYGDVVTTEGVVKICCRNCRVWHRVRIMGRTARLTDTDPPESLPRDHDARVLD